MYFIFGLPYLLWDAWKWCRARPYAWPFLWILLIPIATVPWTEHLLSGLVDHGSCVLVQECSVFEKSWECPVQNVLPTLLPGLLNLVPFLWLSSRQRGVRYAALVAGTLGAVRVAVLALIYVVEGSSVAMTSDYNVSTGFEIATDSSTHAASRILWVVSLGAAIVFPWLVKTDPPRKE